MDKFGKEVQEQCIRALAVLFQVKRIPGNKHATVTTKELMEAGYPMALPTKTFRDHVSFKIRMLSQDVYSIVKVEEWMKSKKPIDKQVEYKPLPIDMSKKKVIRLTETEMVSLIERIVNEVKSQKKQAIKETTRRKRPAARPVSRRRK